MPDEISLTIVVRPSVVAERAAEFACLMAMFLVAYLAAWVVM